MYHRPDMKKTLFKYLLKEISVPFLLGMGVFTFVLLMGRFLKLADMVVSKGVALTDVGLLLVYIFPSFAMITIPMAFLLAVLLAFGRLSTDSEITAIKSCGISLYGLLPPVITFALLAYAATAYITVYALPWGNTSFRQLLYNIIQTKASLTLKEQVFNDEFPGLVIYVDRYDPKRHLVSGVLIHDERKTEEASTIFAKSGTIITDPEKKSIRLRLTDGDIHRPLGKTGYRLIEFNTYDLNITLNNATAPVRRDEADMTLSELRRNLRSAGFSERERREMGLELHKRFSLPVACLIFALIGVPLGIQNQRSGKAGGFSISIAILLIYYVVLTTGKTLGQKGLLDPAFAMWLPNALFLTLGIYLFKKASAEERIPLVGALQNTVRYLAILFKRGRRRG